MNNKTVIESGYFMVWRIMQISEGQLFLQIFFKKQLLSVESYFCHSCYVFRPHFGYFPFWRFWKLKCSLNTLTRFLAINELPAYKIGWRGACDRYSNWYRSIDLFATYAYVACVTDETKLWLSPSAKQRQNHCSGVPPVYQNICQSGWKEILPVIR